MKTVEDVCKVIGKCHDGYYRNWTVVVEWSGTIPSGIDSKGNSYGGGSWAGLRGKGEGATEGEAYEAAVEAAKASRLA